MKIVLVTWGSHGDSRPYVALAAGLKAAGHDPVVLADEEIAPAAAALGIKFEPLAGSLQDMFTTGSHGMAHFLADGKFGPRLLRDVAKVGRQSWYDQIRAAAEGSDVLVGASLATYFAVAVARDLGIPAVASSVQPFRATRDFAPPALGVPRVPVWTRPLIAQALHAIMWAHFRAAVNASRTGHGLRRLSKNPTAPLPLMYPCSPTLLPVPIDWDKPANTWMGGEWLLPTDPSWEPDAALTSFLEAGDPPVYVGFGSMAGFPDQDGLRAAVIDGLVNVARRRVLLASGWAGLHQGHLPEGVHPIGSVPHDWLFPRCAAVVHHCGAGTAHAAARAGTPSIPVPFLADQPFWAAQLGSLGIASTPVDRHRARPQDFAQALATVDRADVRERAKTVATRMAAEDGISSAVASLERLAPN